MAAISVHPIPEGSIIFMSGIEFGFETDDEGLQASMAIFEKISGHRKFCIVHQPTDGGTLEVWGPDTDLEAKIKELLNG